MEDLDYEQTVELEKNIKIKNKAQEIVSGFYKNVSLNLSTKKGFVFTLWSDEHNAEYAVITEKGVIFVCDFLHEDYSVTVEVSHVFKGIKDGYRGISHLASISKVQYNSNEFKQRRGER